MFNLFKKQCLICKMEVDKKNTEFQSGKYFCSKEHAEEYKKKTETDSSEYGGHDGGVCCGM